MSGKEASLQAAPPEDQAPLLTNGGEKELPPIRKAGNIAVSLLQPTQSGLSQVLVCCC